MTVPNVYISWCQNKAKCRWCPEPIEAGTPMVTVFFWNKGNEERRSWNLKLHYHPQCWIDQGLDYLKMNPYVSRKARKQNIKVSSLSPERKEHRVTLMRRKGSLEQRKRNLKSDYPDRVLAEARLDKQIAEIMVEIAGVGGIPPKWLINLT